MMNVHQKSSSIWLHHFLDSKAPSLILLIALILGLFIWIADAALDYFVFYEGRTFLDLLVLNPPKHEIYIRLLVLIFFVCFGVVVSKIVLNLQKTRSELQKANEKITQLSRTDYLTGLFNRMYFQERFKETFSLAKRHGLELTLLLADLDHFKRINDTYGHDGGDNALQAFSSLLIRECRTEDLAARYGGEEIMVMLPETSAEGAIAMYERLREKLIHSDILPGPDYFTFSAGIAEYRVGDTEASLIKKVDDALYEAKHNDRDRYACRV